MDLNADSRTPRRRFLTLTAAGTVAIAGCTDGGDDGTGPAQADAGESPETTPEGTAGARTVSIIVQPDPGGLSEAQAEVRTALEDGELEQEEAEQELAEREQELIDAAIDDARARIDEVGAIHHDTVESEGTLLVEGEADAILDLVEQPSVSAILSQSRFEQAEQRQGVAAGGSDIDPDATEDEVETDDEEADDETEDAAD